MDEQPIKNLTLRELLRDTELLGRELAGHLEQGFAPKADSLASLIRPRRDGPWNHDLESRTLYHSAQQILDSDQFTETLLKRFRGLLKGIDVSVARISTSG